MIPGERGLQNKGNPKRVPPPPESFEEGSHPHNALGIVGGTSTPSPRPWIAFDRFIRQAACIAIVCAVMLALGAIIFPSNFNFRL
jgi:hypothetical protein